MTVVLERTGSSLGTYEELSAQDEEVATRHTPVREVGSESLRAVLAGFDSALGTPMAPMWTFVRTQLQSTGPDPLEAAYVALQLAPAKLMEVLAVGHRLRLMLVVKTDAHPATPPSVSALTGPTVPPAPFRAGAARSPRCRQSRPAGRGSSWVHPCAMCAKPQASRSTFYSWANQMDPRPRLPSQGRLWALVQLVDDLEELLGAPPAAWLRANEEARAMLVGRFSMMSPSSLRGRAGNGSRRLHRSTQVCSPSAPTVSTPTRSRRSCRSGRGESLRPRPLSQAAAEVTETELGTRRAFPGWDSPSRWAAATPSETASRTSDGSLAVGRRVGQVAPR